MTSIDDYNKYGEELETMMRLHTSPLAVKMLESEEDIPEEAVRPWKDRQQHIAQCQAFALSRRQKQTIAMLEEDNWCFAPIIAYGLEDKPDDPELQAFLKFPTFPRNKYIGIVSAPLATANFEPDVIIIYSNTTQLRNMLMPLSFQHADEIEYNFFPPACAYQVIPVMENGCYMITLPDPGDYMRALAGEDEIILSMPADKIGELVTGLQRMRENEYSFERSGMYMLHDFPQPPFYQMLFQRWGLSPKKEDEESKK